MLLTIILFFIGIATIAIMIARKIWLLKSGRIVPGSYEEADWTDMSLISIRYRLVELLRLGVHYAVLATLKAWIITSHTVKKADRYVRAKLMHIIHKNAQYPEVTTESTPSSFLADIKEHKNEIVQTLQKETPAENQ
jgi:hypothetical protein